MKVLLRQDKTIEFISGFDEYGVAQITQNDDLVQTLTVAVEVPLIEGREELFVLFDSADNSSGFFKRIQLLKVNGDYYTLIPQEIVDEGGTWNFQVIRRRHSADKSKSVEKASNKYPFTVGEGVKNAKGELVTKTELQSVYDATVATAEKLESNSVTEIKATLKGKTLDVVGKNTYGEDVAGNEVELDLPYVPTEGGTATGALEIDISGARTSYGAGEITNNGNPITLPQKSGVIALIQDVLDAVSDKTGITFEVVEELPQENAKTNAIYLVPSGENAPNVYDEFVFINNAWEKIGTTAIDLSVLKDYVKFTDYASQNTAGVVKVMTWGNFGIYMYGDGSQIAVYKAENSDIDSKTSVFRPIVPANGDYFVKKSITTNTETLTDEEKAAALAWLGAVKKIATTTNLEQVYCKTAKGEPCMRDVAYVPQGGQIPIYGGMTTTGVNAPNQATLPFPIPTQPYQGVPKKYVDDGFVAKQTNTGSMNVVYGEEHSGKGSKMFTLASGATGDMTIPMRNANGQFDVRTPQSDLNVANKAYVDALAKYYRHTITFNEVGVGASEKASKIMLITKKSAPYTNLDMYDILGARNAYVYLTDSAAEEAGWCTIRSVSADFIGLHGLSSTPSLAGINFSSIRNGLYDTVEEE